MRQQMQSVRQESPVSAGLVRPVLISAVFFMVVTGLVYPLGTTGVSQMLFNRQAQGSIITEHGVDVGSAIIGQWFTEPKYFHPRPSVTTGTDPNDSSKTVDQPYNAANTSGSNLGSTSKKLVDAVTGRVEAYRKENGLGPTDPIPVDAVTASGSGWTRTFLPPMRGFRRSVLRPLEGFLNKRCLPCSTRTRMDLNSGCLATLD